MPGNPADKLPEKDLVMLPEKVLEKFPGKLLEKLPENVLVKEVELKAVKLNCEGVRARSVLLLWTRKIAPPWKHDGTTKGARVKLACEVVETEVVEVAESEHPVPVVTRSETIDAGWEPVFCMVTEMLSLESEAEVIARLPWVMEKTLWAVVGAGAWLFVELEEELEGRMNA